MTFLASQKIVDAYDKAFWFVTGTSIVLMVGIMAAMVYFVFKYHRSRHPKPARIAGSMKLEITWTVIPTIISVAMFFVGYEGFAIARTMPPKPMFTSRNMISTRPSPSRSASVCEE